MRKIATALIAATTLLAVPAALPAKPRLSGEELLAKRLAGREAGKPVTCLPQWQTRDVEVIDGTALVYGRGNTIWVNRPRNPQDLDDNDVMVSRLSGGSFCSLDIVHLYDRSSFFMTGFVDLGEFVPYTRVARAN